MSLIDTTVVVFTHTNARIFRNPDSAWLDEVAKWPNVAINPDLRPVETVPPHFWKLENGAVFPMIESERAARLCLIKRLGVDNHVSNKRVRFKRQHLQDRHIACIFLILILMSQLYAVWKIH